MLWCNFLCQNKKPCHHNNCCLDNKSQILYIYPPGTDHISHQIGKPENHHLQKCRLKWKDVLASLGRVVIQWSLVIQDHLDQSIQNPDLALWRCIGLQYSRISSCIQFQMTNNNEISRKSCRSNNSSVQQPQKPHLSSPVLPSQPPPLPPKHHHRGTCCIHPQSGFGLTHLFGHLTDWFYIPRKIDWCCLHKHPGKWTYGGMEVW